MSDDVQDGEVIRVWLTLKSVVVGVVLLAVAILSSLFFFWIIRRFK